MINCPPLARADSGRVFAWTRTIVQPRLHLDGLGLPLFSAAHGRGYQTVCQLAKSVALNIPVLEASITAPFAVVGNQKPTASRKR
jgi:hypothetical protein